MKPLLLLASLGLATSSCHTMAGPNGLPTLHPRERALYTTLTLEPAGIELKLASLGRQRISESLAWSLKGGAAGTLWVELLADREGEDAFEAELVLSDPETGWESKHRLSPRFSGRWQLELDQAPHGWTTLDVEIEGDPYVEMDRQRPPVGGWARAQD